MDLIVLPPKTVSLHQIKFFRRGNSIQNIVSKSHMLDTWIMSNWPVIHSKTKIERDNLKLVSTRRPVALLAYDVNEDLIPPDRCNTALTGAVEIGRAHV